MVVRYLTTTFRRSQLYTLFSVYVVVCRSL
uniref:Uncharacterized protein n=1 Tax=Schistosoma japonicum TaxID=6182 RepID=Q5BYN4_SCHJA|nr:unknown [Schistosoma japonicum]